MATVAFEAIIDDFELLEDWQDRYRYVIDLGKSMDDLSDEKRISTTKVDGCASQVWICPVVQEMSGEKIFSFEGDSDALIVRGIIAILQALYNGVPVEQIHSIDALTELKRLGLQNHLSTQRSNGLMSMIGYIRQLAIGFHTNDKN